MDRETLFYKRLETEYNELLDDIYNMSSDTKVDNASYISALTEIYDYLVTDKPIKEGAGLDHYIKMDKPLATIISQYMEDRPPIHDRVNPAIWKIEQEKLYDFGNEHKYSTELKWALRMENEQMNGRFPKSIDKDTWDSILEAVEDSGYQFEENEARFLLQFKQPLYVMTKEIGNTNELFFNQVARAVENLKSMDIITGQYSLDREKVLPDMYKKHEAINEFIKIIPQAETGTTMKWLNFYSELREEIIDDGGSEPLSYDGLVEAFETVRDEQGTDIVQKLYDMGNEHVILDNEIVEAGKYLADGGDIEDVPKLANNGYFDCRYEEQDISAERFLEEHGMGTGGMTMQ